MTIPGKIQPMTSSIDHVIVCVPDLAESVEAFEYEHGVASVQGGRHRGHGTANRLVPLGNEYIELVAVVDSEEAAGSAFGSWVAARSKQSAADGIAICTDDLDRICARLQLESLAMSRPAENGELLHWRIAGMEQLVSEGLPFFIQWEVASGLHPAAIPVTHPGGDIRLRRVVISGDFDRLQSWTSGTKGLEVEAGEPGVRFELG